MAFVKYLKILIWVLYTFVDKTEVAMCAHLIGHLQDEGSTPQKIDHSTTRVLWCQATLTAPPSHPTSTGHTNRECFCVD